MELIKDDLTDITLEIDRSGFMESIRSDAEGGVNPFIAEQTKQQGECRIRPAQFDTEYEFLQRGAVSWSPTGFKLSRKSSQTEQGRHRSLPWLAEHWRHAIDWGTSFLPVESSPKSLVQKCRENAVHLYQAKFTVGMTGIEPAHLAVLDPKSSASASSATSPCR